MPQVNEWIKFRGVCVGGGEGRGVCLTLNWVSMLEQRIDEKTINSAFRVSVKTNTFRCDVCESAPFYCLANFDCPQQ